jgi:hypothetical protein
MLPLLLGGGFFPMAANTTSVTVNSVKNSYVSNGVAFPGAVGDGINDDTAAITYWLSQGGFLWFPVGTYRVTATLRFTLNGTIAFGSGCATTSILCDDTAGNIGDVVTLTNLRGCTLSGLTVDAKAQRTAGAAIRISGGDSTHTLPRFNLALGGHTIDVDMNNQFDHVVFNDSGSYGDWDTVVGNPARQMQWSNAASGSHAGIWFNTPNGGGQIVNPVFMTSKQLSDTPGPAVRYTASADITLNTVKHIGMGGGFVADCTSQPSVAGDGLVTMNLCQWDSTSSGGTFHGVLINLGVGVTGTLTVNMGTTWVAGATGDGVHITGNTTPLLMGWASGSSEQNSGWGINGVSHMALGNCVLFSGNGAGTTTG